MIEAAIKHQFEKKVSVIIPTYNRSALLREAINSVVEQTYRPIECVVIDDGSEDDTEIVCNEFKANPNVDFVFLYRRQEKLGAQAARNLGTSLATGDFIQYLDSDDLLYKNKIAVQVSYLNEYPNVDAVFGDVEIGSNFSSIRKKVYKSNDLISQILSFEACIHTLSILYRRNDIFSKINWDICINKCQEIDFQVQALLLGACFDHIPIVCGLWRTHDGPRVMSKLNFNDLIFFFQKQELSLTSHNLFPIELKIKIADWYLYFYHTSKHESFKVKFLLAKEIVRLNPNIPFYSDYKIKLIRNIVGEETSLFIWHIYSQILKKLKK